MFDEGGDVEGVGVQGINGGVEDRAGVFGVV